MWEKYKTLWEEKKAMAIGIAVGVVAVVVGLGVVIAKAVKKGKANIIPRR